MKHSFVSQKFILLVLIFVCQGCLSDEPGPSANFTIDDTAELLIYLESKGDYINNTPTFSLIEAPEVFASLNDNLILDVRPSEEFAQGHIEGAVNLTGGELLDYILERDHQSYNMIVLVSASGQSAAYYTTLLRIYGLSNVYSLKWGMASWNSIFSSIWFDVIESPYDTTSFTNYLYEEKNEFTFLPEIIFDDNSITIESKFEERIRFLLLRGFIEHPSHHIDTDASVSLNKIIRRWDPITETYPGYYIICMMHDLYLYGKSGDFTLPGHPPTTLEYQALIPYSEFRSIKYLQTLPTDETIILYDYNGHYSASFAAYLHILGYNSQSVLYGYNRIHYIRMLGWPCFHDYVFRQDKIHNFPIITD
ncbi:rhodanese-like domain-containing protein [Bacteroidota bacterium]